jgi:glycosyltransferase involved in cell wall biosynthesis
LNQPYISVIVTAYNRRKYLPFALRSLEAQKLPRDKFEVIVVKNFDDKESDDIISRNGWKEVYSDDSYHGRMVLAGLEESKGEVITFLDDDDMYTNNRLEEVYNVFNGYRDLVYFHNSQEFIDEYGRRLENPLRPSKNLVRGDNIAFNPKALQGVSKRYGVSIADLILKYVRARADFNNSSVAVRRHIVESHAQLLKRLPASIDSFVFVSSLKAGGLMYFTDERLTLYRVHGESWTFMSVAKGSKKEMQLRHARALLQLISACKLIGSRLLNDEANKCLCLEEGVKRALLTLPLPELGTLPPELRINVSDVKLALRCYKVGHSYFITRLADLAFVMGHLFLSPILASPRGRLVIGRVLESIRRP